MNLLDRHIFKSVLFTCLGAVGLFAFVLLLGNALRDLGYVLSGQITFATFLGFVWLLVPYAIVYALPMGVLTGVLLTLGRLSADSEITAMRAAGISLTRIARPIWLLGVLGLAAGLYVNFEAMPRTRVAYERKFAAAVRTNPLRFIVPKTFIRDFRGVVVYIGEKNGPEMKDLWLWKLDREGRVREFLRAESALVDYDAETSELILTLTRGQIETRVADDPEDFSEAPYLATFSHSEPQRLPLEGFFGGRAIRQKTKWLTLEELRARREVLALKQVPPEERPQLERERMQVSLTIHDKITTALAVLSFAVIGVPLGIRVSRRETSANLGLAVLLALGYYFLTVMVGWLDRSPEYRPDLLMWIPNLLFLALGGWLFRRAEAA